MAKVATVQEWNEKLLNCPYDPDHHIRPERFGHHLIQCRKALSKRPTSPYFYKIDDLQVCPFNSHHHIPKAKMKEHTKKCQGTVAILKEQVVSNETMKKQDDGISDICSGVEKIRATNEDDDWDSEDVPAYNPEVKAAELPMYLPRGLTPAERRNYRQAKRLGPVIATEPEPIQAKASNSKPKKTDDEWEEVPMHKRGIGRGTRGKSENKQPGRKH